MKKINWGIWFGTVFLGLLVCAGLSTPVQAATVVKTGKWSGITYEMDDEGTLTFTGEGKLLEWADDEEPYEAPYDPDEEYIIKHKNEVKKIVVGEGIDPCGEEIFGWFKNLETAILPSTTTRIDSIFSGCSKLTTVEIPSGIREIGEWSFWGCSSLKEIVIPASVEKIGSSAFKNCSSLTTVTFAGTQVTEIGEECFRFCSVLQTITLPDSITTIGARAFEKCDELQNIKLPSALTRIEHGTFLGCRSLEALTIPENVETIDDKFYHCSKLQKIVILSDKLEGTFAFPDVQKDVPVTFGGKEYKASDFPLKAAGTKAKGKWGSNITWKLSDDGVLTLSGKGKMKNTTSYYKYPWGSYGDDIYSIRIKKGITGVGTHAFEHLYEVDQVDMGSTVKEIGDSAFDCEYGLYYVTFSGKLTKIGDRAFYHTCLEELDLPDGVTTIGENAFGWCLYLQNFKLPKNLKTIGDNAFVRCDAITSVTIPSKVTKIGTAFRYCYALKKIVIRSKKVTGKISFSKIAKNAKIYLPASKYKAYKKAIKKYALPDGVTFGKL